MSDHGFLWNAFARVPLLGTFMRLSDGEHDCGTFKGDVDNTLKSRFFKSEGSGLLIYYRTWSVPNPKAVVFVMHGIAEYCERYAHVAAAFNAAGISFVGIDYEGHGKSEGSPRGYFSRLSGVVADALQLIREVCLPPDVPRFLLGHSFGGLVALHVLHASMRLEAGADPSARGQRSGSQQGWGSWAGLMLSGPALAGDPSLATPLNIFLARTLSSLLPKLEVQALDVNGIAADRSVVAQYTRDPLIAHGPMRVRAGNEILNGIGAIKAFAPTITLPLFIVHGEQDTICLPEGSQSLMGAVASADKTLTLCAGLKHEIFNERAGPEVIDACVRWTLAHAQRSSAGSQ